MVSVVFNSFLGACAVTTTSSSASVFSLGIIGGFILWAISCLFFDYAWTDLTVAWWGVIAGAIIGLYLTYQEVKYMF